MRLRLYILSASMFLACNNKEKIVSSHSADTAVAVDSSKIVPPPAAVEIADSSVPAPVAESVLKKGIHPISLQWISWEKKGEVAVVPLEDGWYSIKGSQSNAENDYLKIDGKIKRISEKELEFDGSIETKVSHIFDGKPCIKTGKQVFAAKGNRKYFRLQNMVNCEGGSLVDYVDIYPGTSSL